jgi:hypothetical protein
MQRGCDPADDDEDLLDVLLRLQEEDSLTSPLTTEIISTFLFVSIFFPLSTLDLNDNGTS